MKAQLTDLARIVAPPAGPPAVDRDWSAIERRLGPLPTDYKLFIDVYGAGRFWGGELGIAPPEWIAATRDESPHGTIGFLRGEAADRSGYVDVVGDGSPDDIYGCATDSYLVFGVSGCGQSLLWRTSGENPDRWPVIATDGAGIDYDGDGMISYLVGLLGGTAPSAAFDEDWLHDVMELHPDEPYVRVER
ncbi:SMI1/KNR4 family protein [Tsukamurella pulmonis]|uniref:SMI1/KNR4 family protein n=1 Tax=Tsukamurella pulmonis TaxID=47312 RepID=UPI001EDD954C|nr:SMI1/KNR4 family protein [Tsukamurella pulmonis]